MPLYTGTSAGQIDLLETRIEEWAQVYEGDLISADHRMGAIIVQPDAGTSQHELDDMLDEIGRMVALEEAREEVFRSSGCRQ